MNHANVEKINYVKTNTYKLLHGVETMIVQIGRQKLEKGETNDY